MNIITDMQILSAWSACIHCRKSRPFTNSWILTLVSCVLVVQCSAQVEVDAVEMTVSGLRDTDIYRCEIEILFPPPYIRLRGNVTLIHVLGKTSSWHACACKDLGLLFWVQLLQPLRPCVVFTENSECSEQQAHMQIADSYEERDDEGKDKIAQVNVPVGILVILILLALFVIICFQVRLNK